MSEKELVPAWLFAGENVENIKFFRGSRDMITVEEFLKEFNSALMQKKLKRAEVSSEAPRSEMPKVKLREFVDSL